jgi:hypothetical protein
MSALDRAQFSRVPLVGAAIGELYVGAKMTGTPMQFVASLFAALSVGVASSAHASEQRPVRMALQSVTLTNSPWHTGYWHVVVFVVTNGGSKPVAVTSCGASFVRTNLPMPLGLFGRCAVPPLTSSTMRIVCKPSSNLGPQWFRYAVFEQPDVLWKAGMTARSLEASALGKGSLTRGWLSSLWSTNNWVAAYEITSPSFTLPDLPSPFDEMRPSAAWEAGSDLIDDGVLSPGESLWPQPLSSPNGGPATRSGNAGPQEGRHR